MFEHGKILELNDFFVSLNDRRCREVYFYRINGYTEEIGGFIRKYYEVAQREGIIIEGKIPNPDEKNLEFFHEIMGFDFEMNEEFILKQLEKWLPRMNCYKRNDMAVCINHSLQDLQKAGKNINILKNIYTKFMCWLYYKFERIVNRLGEANIPKILYEGNISCYELILLSILSNLGCDIILLQYDGDMNYLKLDSNSMYSNRLEMVGMEKFPNTFSLRFIREQIQKEWNNKKLYGKKPDILNCTNAWIKGTGLEDFKTSIENRGNDPKLFYNCYCRINGVEDKLTYVNELFQFQLEMKHNKRRIVIVDEGISLPSVEEIASISRSNYSNAEQMLSHLSSNIQHSANIELQKIMVKAFIDVMLEESNDANNNLNKLTNKAVYLLCWLKRYQSLLFSNWKITEISCFIYMGGCKNRNEALFMKLLARMPVDVLILNPDLHTKCCLEDSLLYEITYSNHLDIKKYPQENADVHIGTVAYHAERELDTLMYQNAGIYRNHQYKKANTIVLQTMYEEIKLLWNEELKYRPNFSTIDNVVNIPVIFSKVAGVKDGNISEYWLSIKELITEDTFVINKAPFIERTAFNPMKPYVTQFFKNGKVQKEKIKAHTSYPYGFLREDMQEHILDKLQILIDQNIIKGTFQNGTEYTIIATVLNLGKDILRLLQRFDFTKKNPKLLYIHTKENIVSLEDAILVAYLSLLGFDVVFFVPTGYQIVEKYFNRKVIVEHQIGDYVYDLEVPDVANFSIPIGKKWFDKVLGKWL